MKILKLSNSLLFLRIEKESVKCFFIYFISWNSWVTSKSKIGLKDITVKIAVQVYKDLVDEWNRKYRV